MALVDLLKSIGIKPDGFIGHSVGELGCAYADGTFTVEQTVLIAYSRGYSILETKLHKGSMAAVGKLYLINLIDCYIIYAYFYFMSNIIGLSWEETKARLPADIFAACHNSEDSVTISGPPLSVSDFVKNCKTEGIFAKEVNSSGFAFHSKYIADAEPKLRRSLEVVSIIG